MCVTEGRDSGTHLRTPHRRSPVRRTHSSVVPRIEDSCTAPDARASENESDSELAGCRGTCTAWYRAMYNLHAMSHVRVGRLKLIVSLTTINIRRRVPNYPQKSSLIVPGQRILRPLPGSHLFQDILTTIITSDYYRVRPWQQWTADSLESRYWFRSGHVCTWSGSMV